MKKTVFVWGILLLFAGVSVEAQQLTRFAVVDLNLVYTEFFRDSRAVRAFEERSAAVQAEIDRMNSEILSLKSSLLDAQLAGNRSQALQLETKINQQTEFLNEYYQVKIAELETQRSTLARTDAFLTQVNDEIRYIAESEGYSMVLNLRENAGILWYSPTVDITQKVIDSLRTKAGS